MIKYTSEDFDKVKKCFPNLYYEKNCIRGELNFNACYEKRLRKNGKCDWKIVSRTSGRDCLIDCYEIKIFLDYNIENGWPKIFETGRRIEKLANEIGRPIIDMHLYPNDKSCCLGICINPDITLSSFILNIVYPYFVWQAYFDKNKTYPPCGQYSHGAEGIKECLQKLEEIGRNDLCICTSGKKYKKCCIHDKEAIKKRLTKCLTVNRKPKEL